MIKAELAYLHQIIRTAEGYENPPISVDGLRKLLDHITALETQLAYRDERIPNLAMMLRRMIWQAKKEIGATSMKVLAGKAAELLKSYGLEGSPLRAADAKEGEGK